MITPGKVAVIVGGSRGVGRACAECLLSRGAKVCIADTDEATGRAAEEELRARHGMSRAIFVQCDVTSGLDVEKLFLEVNERMGAVDIFCPASDTTDSDDWRQCLDVIYKGAIRSTYEAMKYMSQKHGGSGGVVIFMTSSVAIEPHAKFPVYCASRYALVGFLRAWAAKPHFDEHGIRFNGLCLPSAITPTKYQPAQASVEHRTVSSVANRIASRTYTLAAKGFLRLVQDDFLNGQILKVMNKTELASGEFVKFPPFKRATGQTANS